MALTAKKVYAILKRQISDMEAKLNSPVRYRGTVATADLLPLNPDIGDMYNIESKSVYGEAGMNVAWNGVVWDTLGPAIDMAPYLREDSEIITSLKTKTENLESANYTDRGTLADTDAFLINDGTGMKKSVLSKLSDFVLNKIADKVFAKLQTNDKTILGAINELNSKAGTIYSKGIANYGAAYDAVVIHSPDISVRELGLFVMLAGSESDQFGAFIYGVSDNEVKRTEIMNNGNVSVTGDLTGNSITIKIGNWGRGVVFSYARFDIEIKKL